TAKIAWKDHRTGLFGSGRHYRFGLLNIAKSCKLLSLLEEFPRDQPSALNSQRYLFGPLAQCCPGNQSRSQVASREHTAGQIYSWSPVLSSHAILRGRSWPNGIPEEDSRCRKSACCAVPHAAVSGTTYPAGWAGSVPRCL